MKRVRFILNISFLFFAALVYADDLEFKILNDVVKEVDPGTNINLMVAITNPNEENRFVKIQLKSDDDAWKLLSDYSSISVEKKSTVRKIIGIHIPSGLKAGQVSIGLEAIDIAAVKTFGSATYSMNVVPQYAISLEKFEAPQFLFAGDTTSLFYLVRNQSNVDVTIKMQVNEGAEEKTNVIKLAKDSSAYMRYPISVQKNIEGYTQRSFFVNASIQEKPDTRQTIYYSIDIFRVGKSKFDPYIRFPIRVSGVAAMTNSYGNLLYSGMYEVDGRGMIGNPTKSRQLEFRMRGPNRNGNPLFGLNDEYYLRYITPKLNVTVGDYNYGLSELTESSRMGLGAGISYITNKLTFGGYYNSPKYYPLIKHIFSVYTNYKWNEKNNTKFGVLAKIDTTSKMVQLATLSSENSFFPWLNSKVEFSLGHNQSIISKAYKASFSAISKIVSTSVDYSFADVAFPGYLSNTQRLYSSFSVNLKKIILAVNYNRNSSNQALDTLFANQPISEGFGFTTGWRISELHALTIGGMISSTKENSDNPLYDYKKYNGRFAFQSQIKALNITLQGDAGKMRNYLSGNGIELTNFYTGSINAHLTISKVISAVASASYQGGQKGVTGSEEFYYGGALMSDFNNVVSLSLQYNSNFEWKDYSSDRNLFSMNLSSNINDNNQVAVSANYNLIKNSLENKAFTAQVRYTHTLNVPISKRKDIGTLSGRIINKGVDKVSGIRLNLNGQVAITDKEGNFRFPAIQVGSYILGIDVASFGLHTIAEAPGPYSIAIKPSEVTYFEFAMTKAVRIQGKVVVKEDENANQKGYIAVNDPMERLIVEASSGSEMYRVLTDKNGGFTFEDLRPGSWQVKVYPNGLPKGYQLLTPQFNLTITSGNEEKIEVLVQKKARQIQFQKIN